jgi:hypothetical protein
MPIFTRSCIVLLLSSATACAGSYTTPTATPSITQAGIWSYALSVNVPLNATPDMSCMSPASGTTVVSSNGAFSIPFSVACARCAENGTIAGTVAGTSVSGNNFAVSYTLTPR